MNKVKILDDVKRIVDSFNLKEIEFPKEYVTFYNAIRYDSEMYEKYTPEKNDGYFYEKYHKNISPGFYGFAIGTPIVSDWCEILDSVLELCIKNDENFKIQQIKLKFGRICFYTSSEVIDDLHDVEVYLLTKLYDKSLIY